MSTTFQARVFQNTYLAQGADEVHAIVSVTASDAENAPAATAPLALGLIIDSSGSMGENGGDRLEQAKTGVREAIALLREDCSFFLLAGSDSATVLTPLLPATAANKTRALAALNRLRAGGGTRISSWLLAAREQFPEGGNFVRQALLLTDGKNAEEKTTTLGEVVAICEGRFQCDARGVGVDWEVEQLRAIAGRLLGTVDIIPEPAGIAADFKEILSRALTRTVAEARLRLWTPQGATIAFCRQVSPDIAELTTQALPHPQNPQQIRDYPLGAWSGREARDYHVCIRVKPGSVGQKMLAGRASVVIADGANGMNETKAAESQILAIWTDDEARSAVISPEVAHYTGQGELAQAIKEGLEARRVGDDDLATRKLGRAVQLAAAGGNESTTKLLRKVVDVLDEDAGTVKLRRGVEDADAMALDTRSTKTTRRLSPL